MADLADVENAIKALVIGIVYPNGNSSPSIVNEQVTIGRGWPLAKDIDTALAAGSVIVSIFSPPGMERNTTRYPRDDEVLSGPSAGAFHIWTEEKRQERQIQITCWCPTPALRDALVGPLDLALCLNSFIATTDQSAVRFRYARTAESDEGEKVQIFRRDLFYTAEYPTALITTVPETTSIDISTSIDGGPTQTQVIS